MITSIILKRLHDQKIANPGSKKVSMMRRLFNDGKFDPDNWDGGDDIITTIITELYNGTHGHIHRILTPKNISEPSCCEYITMNCDYYDEKYCMSFITSRNDQYLIKYSVSVYKIDNMIKNGQIMIEDDYIELLNLLESCGYDFSI